MDAWHVLQGLPRISFVEFAAADVVRHPVVAEIINAYAKQAQEEEQ
jgi:phosphate starvation-inducible PhoH-like protein